MFLSGQHKSQIEAFGFSHMGSNEYMKWLKRPRKKTIGLKATVGERGISFETKDKKNYTADEVKELLNMAAEFATASCGLFLWNPNV